MLENEATMAKSLIHTWGTGNIVKDSGKFGDLESTNYRLQNPQELVDRAFEVSEYFWQQARAKGFVHTTPTPPHMAD